MKLQEKIVFSQSLLILSIVFSVLSILISPILLGLSLILVSSGTYIIYISGLSKEDRLAVISAYVFFGIFSLLLPSISSYSSNGFSSLFFVILVLLVGLILWKVKFERNYTFGKVLLTDSKLAGIEVEYDMRSNVRAGRYVVDNPKKAKKGKKVKVLVKKSSFSASTPYEII